MTACASLVNRAKKFRASPINAHQKLVKVWTEFLLSVYQTLFPRPHTKGKKRSGYARLLLSRVRRYWICDMQLFHEILIAIIAILHAKIELQPHSLKSLQCQHECCFHWEVVYKHNFFCRQIKQLTWVVVLCMRCIKYEAQNWHKLDDKCNNYF